MKNLTLALLIITLIAGCKKTEAQKKTTIRNNNNNMITSTKNIEFSDLFNEGSIIRFTPKDLENPKNEEEKEFKRKLQFFEKQNQLIKYFDLDNLKILVNNQTFSNAEYFINSEWLQYFIDKFHILNLNSIFSLAIEQEDLNAINIILKTGYIISEEEVNKSVSVLENSDMNTKNNKERNGMDENGDPTFYDSKESKAKEIHLKLLNKYNYKTYDKDGFSNLRDDAFSSAFILDTIRSGSHIDILDNSNQEWLYIKKNDNKKGYLHKSKIVSE